ncbi:MAG: transcriptional regulator NrdR [Gammaproteobacteria bacterium]|nr:transcriptional regulator NrdR [Gammaproteobacteria bacterium]
MRCPGCGGADTRVLDSRLGDGGECVRRRRSCRECDMRFTTFEHVARSLPRVVKANGGREKFSEEKLRLGMLRALEKRPIESEAVEGALARILRRFTLGEREVAARDIGEAVMEELSALDEVAYVRFASVYRKFQDIDAFRSEVEKLEGEKGKTRRPRKACLAMFRGR